MDTRGKHLIVEYHGCDREVLNDLEVLERRMTRAAEAAGATVVGKVFHPFSPQGVSGVVVVEESHLSIHTWPEAGYAAVDFYTCGDCRPERAHEVLKRALGARRSERMTVHRGLTSRPRFMEVAAHCVDRAGDDRDVAGSRPWTAAATS